ncbi:MAG TPA: 23S rRNA pseudouridine(2604) synthase RluF [Algoriphagus sp.]|nr:23S rRNA pseudouridine(2604) synthase RluF [Algoriphagus sp.]MAN88696.1 23S rRNA pseudouridine(2604) synthase RluF [Algoriphagus sp.]HAS59394.1 23S rRNA pseudouridine(2604) synthase RluF [Algoriphagus sp.]HCB44819.1 23S rRNA pseudouridine(2604) synthase RluF [Algoriphagus sp.]HCD89691.1 23S rRNA pseudouridine(2604) synthase RluF [Algoriphagus sp.]
MLEKDQYIRINKYLSEVGFCSRREADKLLEQGRITLNGKIPELGTKVGPSDKVAVDGKPVGKPIQEHTYIAFNKPVGIVSTTDTKGEKNNIIDYIGHPVRIFPVGRLDKDSEGLIFLTSEGDIVNKILRASNNHEKEYVVTVDKPIDKRFIQRMSDGIPILGTVTKKCKVEQISRFKFRIVLTQGLNRQIRRMCEYLGYQVKQLIRVRIMNVHLDLPTGKWRDLTEKEMKELNRLIADSSKTAE